MHHLNISNVDSNLVRPHEIRLTVAAGVSDAAVYECTEPALDTSYESLDRLNVSAIHSAGYLGFSN